jgi:hypothetical protein
MGTVKRPAPVKLFAAFTLSAGLDPSHLLDEIEHQLSGIEQKSNVFEFSKFTDYYQDEMGTGLLKQFLVFKNLIEPDRLPDIKVLTNSIETKYGRNEKRSINIDPGYVCDSKVILATTKNYSHRIYLGSGIYGDVHLIYQKHSFQVQPWTYPDYRQESVITFFNQVRENYLTMLKDYPAM